jgi:hypothetical protein
MSGDLAKLLCLGAPHGDDDDRLSAQRRASGSARALVLLDLLT